MVRDYLVWDPVKKTWVQPFTGKRQEGKAPRPGQSHWRREREPQKPRRNRRLEGRARLAQVNRLAARDGLKCRWCDVDLTIFGQDETTRATVDHYPVPKAAGGGNNDSNAVLSCKPCNEDRAKGKKGKARIESRKMFVAWQRENA